MQLKDLADELARMVADRGYSHEALGIWLSRHHVAVEAALRGPAAKNDGEVERLMKRCQRGVGGRNSLADAHDIMAECYGTLGYLLSEVERLQATTSDRRIVTDPASVCNSSEAEADAVEAVARAICAVEFHSGNRMWDEFFRAGREKYRAFARAALSALPRPGETTCCKGLAPLDECKCALPRPAVDEGAVP